MLLLVAVITIVIVWAYYLRRHNAARAMSAPRLVGDGRFSIAVVGESKYMNSFRRICGPRTADGVNMRIQAYLTMENNNKFDDQAVRVSIKGHTVGYLPRAVARDFRRSVVGAGHGASQVFACEALIRGGWDDGRGNVGNYGVVLDLP